MTETPKHTVQDYEELREKLVSQVIELYELPDDLLPPTHPRGQHRMEFRTRTHMDF